MALATIESFVTQGCCDHSQLGSSQPRAPGGTCLPRYFSLLSELPTTLERHTLQMSAYAFV
eukprot:5736655-Amphidinium_carterae.1